MDGYFVVSRTPPGKEHRPLAVRWLASKQASASVDGGEDRSERLRTQAEGAPTAIAYAVWKGQQRARGRHLVEARRRLVEYYESTP